MKKLITICLVCALTTAAWGVNEIISFDENGGGSVPYGTNPSLYYVLSPNVTVGDVVIYENPEQTILSDLLRFTNIDDPTHPETTIGCVFVYSDIGDNDLADVGIPTDRQSNLLSLTENGTEGSWNGLDAYTPTYITGSGFQPGYIDGDDTYHFTSNVPEPATLCLLGLGALSLIHRKARSVT